MDVLQAMRGLSGQTVLEPLAAAELWQDTGSRQAYRDIAPLDFTRPYRARRDALQIQGVVEMADHFLAGRTAYVAESTTTWILDHLTRIT